MLERRQHPPVPPTAAADGSEADDVPFGALQDCVAIRDWLLSEGARLPEPDDLIAGFAERLNAVGVPVDRTSTAIDTLHSEYSGIGRIWTRESGTTVRLFPHGEASERAYAASPFRKVHEDGEWLILDLAETPDDAYSVIPDLRAAGYRHYIVVPLFFTNGTHNGITFATRDPDGFRDEDVAILRFIMPALAAVMEMRIVTKQLDTVLRIYVGDEPHRAILSGDIRRGQVKRIRSAILFADMRDYTRISANMTPEEAVDLLNIFFDCLVPPIEREGGEVLKYLGDGLLAIFREPGDDLGGAAKGALTAAQSALAALEEANTLHQFTVPMMAGIALHHGEAAYGNVGSGTRLDFTVIGRDVNMASRIARLNKTLGEPLLMSKPFVDFLWGDPVPLGEHVLDGFAEPMMVYRPRPKPHRGQS
ncbi:adenylate/guanylate cyclase domain-containing protein [Methylobacterium sp. WL30]|uniref:adenylate/guanylate cyclase domain-containing protein n=1 Tax=unclassified Methylobacterium TaxID=2615210 RepID=UPI0011CC994E|nr:MULTISPECIES: adenylate/guanylate cyclase domain-containing protein [unclassified Methylobacterium]TXM93573.1 adenylate/guanylate cyclase domain-containing protein [Methylobacterium sp. WL116]TXN40867.1 adenylate/guanylate cyclase domain-containing protein [Methylobacterium sp. WL93]TXN49548.1 adenylate/guanylate cyclase domain-containing protein [Methylobacterium sp. WL119]TXN70736.1 adenylate/guanylate cyclase domain-containing protein [Methylobacterium sp. WL30]